MTSICKKIRSTMQQRAESSKQFIINAGKPDSENSS